MLKTGSVRNFAAIGCSVLGVRRSVDVQFRIPKAEVRKPNTDWKLAPTQTFGTEHIHQKLYKPNSLFNN